MSALNWEVVRDKAHAVLAFDPDNGDALAFQAAAERAHGQTVVGDSPNAAPAKSPSASPLPVFFKDGRYMVKKMLGEGANKILS